MCMYIHAQINHLQVNKKLIHYSKNWYINKSSIILLFPCELYYWITIWLIRSICL